MRYETHLPGIRHLDSCVIFSTTHLQICSFSALDHLVMWINTGYNNSEGSRESNSLFVEIVAETKTKKAVMKTKLMLVSLAKQTRLGGSSQSNPTASGHINTCMLIACTHSQHEYKVMP